MSGAQTNQLKDKAHYEFLNYVDEYKSAERYGMNLDLFSLMKKEDYKNFEDFTDNSSYIKFKHNSKYVDEIYNTPIQQSCDLKKTTKNKKLRRIFRRL